MARLQKLYKEELAPALLKELGLANVMEVPRLEKITINMGVGEAVNDKKIMDNAVRDLGLIAGQKPLITKSKKSIAGFKIRDGWPIGCKVTLRREQMYEFLDRLINVSLPRTRDFRGLSAKSFDGRGNYTFGVKEHIIFPEIDFEKTDAMRGMDITFTTSAKTDEQAKALLAAFGFPFKG
ncbi:50S ribosomal protein L5 [Suttonella indologenes]|uniref:Large ribosomal subunit protein uL5 n=1 Tax=Suttonella indologenes TaxID=13276 RepID=A0A380MU91_9GAMM|nr:50S ribosomal protein L5 [Suttonella indologenes]SUO96145.1 50S ribosomal protein L5 [Suttonella indologenes]